MQNEENISWISGTPLGINIRKLSFIVPHRHENLIEITLCLTGTIKFSYYYEEFTLKPGEFILVDKDVHYFYGGEAVCVSFYIDLNFFKETHPYLDSTLFVCEGTSESTLPHDTYYHQYLRSILLTLLLYLNNQDERDSDFKERITSTARKIIDLMIDRFDVIFYYHSDLKIKPEALLRYRKAMQYMHEHDTEKVSVKDIADHCGVSTAYMSEFLSNVTLGFNSIIGYLRAYKSEKYLTDTDMCVVEISEVCGFSDPKYYYAAFKKWYGCTPGRFRTRYRKEMHKENGETELDISEIVNPLSQMIEQHLVNMFL